MIIYVMSAGKYRFYQVDEDKPKKQIDASFVQGLGLGHNASIFGDFSKEYLLKRLYILSRINMVIEPMHSIISDSIIGIISGLSFSIIADTSYEFRMADISEDSSLAKRTSVVTKKANRIESLNYILKNKKKP